jgi:hypothetical protein
MLSPLAWKQRLIGKPLSDSRCPIAAPYDQKPRLGLSLALGSSGKQIRQEYPLPILFDGQQLRKILRHTANQIELRNEYGRCCRFLPAPKLWP